MWISHHWQPEPQRRKEAGCVQFAAPRITHLGMDVHKDSISIGILAPEDDSAVEKIFHDEASVRR